jgi:3-oxoacyl-[acyl-carrier-protein] synthase-3
MSLEEMAVENIGWDIEKIREKTGINRVYISEEGQTAVDLAYEAAIKLFEHSLLDKNKIDLILLVTQAPDYLLPTSACILQNLLGLSTKCMAFDVNLGCSGFVNALGIAGSLIESNVANKAIILCADTYSKFIEVDDRTCRPIFSDGAAAILLENSEAKTLGPFNYGTDGSGYDRLIVRGGGAREGFYLDKKSKPLLEMHGSDVFLFTMRVVPDCIRETLRDANLTMQDIDLFVFHQASKLVIDNLCRVLSLSPSKVFNNYSEVGNTVSASIPIALKGAQNSGKLKGGDRVMLVGFGVGLSWGSTVIHWSEI